MGTTVLWVELGFQTVRPWWPPSSSSLSSHWNLHEHEWRGLLLRTNQGLKPEAVLEGHLRPSLLLFSTLHNCAFQNARSLAGQSSGVLGRVYLQSIQLSSKFLLWLFCHSSGACVHCLLRTVKSMGCIDTWITFCTAGKHTSGWQTEMNGTHMCCFILSKSCVFWAKVRDTKQQDGLVGEGACHQVRKPKFNPQGPHGGGREQTPTCCPWSSTPLHIHSFLLRWINKYNKFFAIKNRWRFILPYFHIYTENIIL